MSLIYEGVLDAFKLMGFQPNLKYNSLWLCADYAKCHQGQQPQSGISKSLSTPTRIPEMSSIIEGVFDMPGKYFFLSGNLKSEEKFSVTCLFNTLFLPTIYSLQRTFSNTKEF